MLALAGKDLGKQPQGLQQCPHGADAACRALIVERLGFQAQAQRNGTREASSVGALTGSCPPFAEVTATMAAGRLMKGPSLWRAARRCGKSKSCARQEQCFFGRPALGGFIPKPVYWDCELDLHSWESHWTKELSAQWTVSCC